MPATSTIPMPTDRGAPQSSPASGPTTGYGLRFISGKYQGGEFPLEEGQEVVIGRSSELDMVLVEEMVSRRHARIELRDSTVTIEDLGSTNGTFVNGEKIQRAMLREGDRVLIGTSILRLVASGTNQAASVSERSVARRAPLKPAEAPRMSGSLEEIPLPDLMQLFATSRKTGMLVLRGENLTGRLHLKNGVIHFAEIDELPDLPPLKATYRMIGWDRGHFELDPPDTRTFDDAIDVSAQEVLMEGFRQQDELTQIKDKLPPPEARFVLATPLEASLGELGTRQLDVLQRAINSPNLQAVFDSGPLGDLEIAQIVVELLERKYLRRA